MDHANSGLALVARAVTRPILRDAGPTPLPDTLT